MFRALNSAFSHRARGRTLPNLYIHRLLIACVFLVFAQGSDFSYANCETESCDSQIVNLGTIANIAGTSVATASNSDGSVVVGQSSSPSGYPHAFRWTELGGTNDLGTIGGAVGPSIATGTNADGSIVVGQSVTTSIDQFGKPLSHAFRWASDNGMIDIGTIGNVSGASRANGINADGSVVVGFSLAPTDTNGSGYYHAFRWTSGAGMVDLGTIGGIAGFSTANAISGDGLVVVGESAVPKTDNQFYSHAFRWTLDGGMVDLGTLGNTAGYSRATATNSDGTVVVGQSTTLQDSTGNSFTHAFRWMNATGMVDIGTPGNAIGNSRATGVSGDASVIIGQYANNCGECAEKPFRWTANTGVRDLNQLMSDAGLQMDGVVLYSASGISSDGQFIVGNAKFDTDPAYIARYSDGPDSKIAGVTTLAALQRSVNQLTDQRFRSMIQQNLTAAPLLGANQSLNSTSSMSIYGQINSTTLGSRAQLSDENGFTLMGGLAYQREDHDSGSIDGFSTAAVALRYVHLQSGALKPFFEVGGWWTPDAEVEFTRSYANADGAGGATALTNGDYLTAYARLGLVFDHDSTNQVALSIEAARQWMSLGRYAEASSSQNPFEASSSAGTDILDIARLRAQWTHDFTQTIDTTLWVGLAHSFSYSNGIDTVVAGVGLMSASNTHDNRTWAEYGARIGYKLNNLTTVDTFVNGIVSDFRADRDMQVGVSLRVQF